MEKLQDIEESLYRLVNGDEEITSDNKYSYEEEYAVNLFKTTVKREKEGKYTIQPVFKNIFVPLKNNYYVVYCDTNHS